MQSQMHPTYDKRFVIISEGELAKCHVRFSSFSLEISSLSFVLFDGSNSNFMKMIFNALGFSTFFISFFSFLYFLFYFFFNNHFWFHKPHMNLLYEFYLWLSDFVFSNFYTSIENKIICRKFIIWTLYTKSTIGYSWIFLWITR